MLATLRRYARAFVLALRFTLRGEKPPLLRARDQHPELAAWWDQTVELVSAVESAARVNGIDANLLIIHVDKRDIRMATILALIRYHAQHEYPYLMARPDQYSRMTIDATNLNDRYLIKQLASHLNLPLNASVAALDAHLAALTVDHKEEV